MAKRTRRNHSAAFKLYKLRRRHKELGKRFPNKVYWSTLPEQDAA